MAESQSRVGLIMSAEQTNNLVKDAHGVVTKLSCAGFEGPELVYLATELFKLRSAKDWNHVLPETAETLVTSVAVAPNGFAAWKKLSNSTIKHAERLVGEVDETTKKKKIFDGLLKRLDRTVFKKNKFSLNNDEKELLQEYRIGDNFAGLAPRSLWQAVRKQALAIHRVMIGIDAEIQQKTAALDEQQAILLDLKKACNRARRHYYRANSETVSDNDGSEHAEAPFNAVYSVTSWKSKKDKDGASIGGTFSALHNGVWPHYMRLVGVVDKQEREKRFREKVIAQYALGMQSFHNSDDKEWDAEVDAAFIDQFVQAKINAYGRFYLDITGLTLAEKNALIDNKVWSKRLAMVTPIATVLASVMALGEGLIAGYAMYQVLPGLLSNIPGMSSAEVMLIAAAIGAIVALMGAACNFMLGKSEIKGMLPIILFGLIVRNDKREVLTGLQRGLAVAGFALGMASGIGFGVLSFNSMLSVITNLVPSVADNSLQGLLQAHLGLSTTLGVLALPIITGTLTGAVLFFMYSRYLNKFINEGGFQKLGRMMKSHWWDQLAGKAWYHKMLSVIGLSLLYAFFGVAWGALSVITAGVFIKQTGSVLAVIQSLPAKAITVISGIVSSMLAFANAIFVAKNLIRITDPVKESVMNVSKASHVAVLALKAGQSVGKLLVGILTFLFTLAVLPIGLLVGAFVAIGRRCQMAILKHQFNVLAVEKDLSKEARACLLAAMESSDKQAANTHANVLLKGAIAPNASGQGALFGAGVNVKGALGMLLKVLCFTSATGGSLGCNNAGVDAELPVGSTVTDENASDKHVANQVQQNAAEWKNFGKGFCLFWRAIFCQDNVVRPYQSALSVFPTSSTDTSSAKSRFVSELEGLAPQVAAAA